MDKHRIGILGSGDVGQVLGAGFAAAGHEVLMGTRDPNREKVKAWADRVGPRAHIGTFAQAADFGPVVVLCTLWTGTKNAIDLAGPERLAGKIVIDATNPLDFSKGMPPTLSVAGNDSAGERVQRWLPESKVVKCFNSVGSLHMVRPSFPQGTPDMFLCGSDPEAKETVSALCASLGWPTVDIGGIEGARYLEPLAMIWVSVLAKTGSANHAFSLLRK